MRTVINLAERIEPKLEPLTNRFSIAMWVHQLDRFDYIPGCRCQICRLENKVSSIFGILENAQRASQAGKGAA